MNVSTGEIRDFKNVTEQERASGEWVRIPRAYTPKPPPVTEADFAALNSAEAKRARKNAARRMFAAIAG